MSWKPALKQTLQAAEVAGCALCCAALTTVCCFSLTVHTDRVCYWQMIFTSTSIPLVLLVDMSALLMYNLSGMCVTGEPAAHHAFALHLRCPQRQLGPELQAVCVLPCAYTASSGRQAGSRGCCLPGCLLSHRRLAQSAPERRLPAGYLGAVFRTVLETMRTLFVWLVRLQLQTGFAQTPPADLHLHSTPAA